MKTTSKAKRTAPLMEIGSHLEGPNAKALIAALSSALELAIVTGREDAAITLADRLGSMGEVSNVNISGCSLQG